MAAERELVGNAAQDGDLAWVRLTVSGQRIEHAAGEGPGMGDLVREVAGRTLFEAASVPGRRLAADALHDALGPAVKAAPSDSRVAVAMSGGVDSAVALLRVRDAGHDPVGVTLRLWTDPAGKSSERVCCSPASAIAAREACHALGFPHVTLDLRESFRKAVVAPFVRGYARGETPNPCIRCNGGFRFGALLAFATRIGASRLAGRPEQERRDSNPQPVVLETTALPVELRSFGGAISRQPSAFSQSPGSDTSRLRPRRPDWVWLTADG